MIKKISKISFFLFITSTLFFSSCKQEEAPVDDNQVSQIELQVGNKEELLQRPQKWHLTNKRVLVLFGYDFNTPQVYEPILQMLKEEYGLDDDGGLILPLVYPNDFKHGSRGYSNDLFTILQDSSFDFSGVLLIGAPEGTHLAIARNQDAWEDVPYPVFALFPQDDILGLEATCDLVIDKGFTSGLKGETVEEETITQAFPEAPLIIKETIDYMLALKGPLSKDSQIQNHLLQMYSDKKIHHYTDPESGLHAINHFVLN